MPGNAPRYFSNVRGPGIHNLDTEIFKEVHFKENMFLQLRAEFFNFLNTPRFSLPGESSGDTSFGTITSQFNSPRGGQVGVRFVF